MVNYYDGGMKNGFKLYLIQKAEKRQLAVAEPIRKDVDH